ncbi:MAG TPA: ATP-grasp domain-containing protein [Candidatus Limnocylindrales bacterium]|nr:ATP-grasp domain-containing protein [Candidatus Limnocylindrales bacterium]
MKIVLIITSSSEKTVAWKERERYVKEFCETVEARLEKVKVRYTTYDKLQFAVRNGQTAITDTQNDIDLKQTSLVHFKNWMYETEEAPLTASYLKKHGIAFFNSEVDIPVSSGKISQMFRLGEQGIPVPDTFYARRSQLRQIFSAGKLPAGFSLPLIMKATFGSKGDDNHLVASTAQALQILNESAPDIEFVLQNFIPNDGDYRFLFVGFDKPPIIFHRQSVSGTHLNNTSKGGTGRVIQANELPAQYLQYARKAAEVLRREIGGVDIIVDKKTGKPYILEVNGTPALATGYDTDKKLNVFVEFLERMLEAEEEE